jgi:hypothetical protein
MKNEKLLVIDRFEGDVAVCLDDEERAFDLPRTAVADLGEGECFRAAVEGERVEFIKAMPEETARRRAEAEAMLASLFGKK